MKVWKKAKKNEQIAIAKEMKKENMDISFISRLTSLTIEEIEKL